MTLFTPAERAEAEQIARLIYVNPFTADRIAYEREALGDAFVDESCAWNADACSGGRHANIDRLTDRAGALAEAGRGKLAAGATPAERDVRLYEDVVLFFLYHQYHERLTVVIEQALLDDAPRRRITFYKSFEAQASHYLDHARLRATEGESPAHLFAFFFQVRRAFHHIFTNIVGRSAPACRLRAAVWESIFTHDTRRYRRALYDRMGDVATLITGPSGTGKELVARAIGLSRYIPFDPAAQSFAEDFAGSFHALSLSALSPTLIESELFGHRRGAFTGALEDRAGWLEVCRPRGAVFLDEVGEIDPTIQVKLLRVLQARSFQRLGDTQPRRFRGKIIAATHRDLAKEMRWGRFREDFYYRICSDRVTTPSLHELLGADETELSTLVRFIAHREAGEEGEALAREVEAWIARHLGRDYRWPGNFRELEQCVRNVLVRGVYQPAIAGANGDGDESLALAIAAGSLTADQLLARYCGLIYGRTHSYEETARRLGIDRRTVKARVSSVTAITA